MKSLATLRKNVALLLGVFASFSAAAQAELFGSFERLEVVINGPIAAIWRDREDDASYHNATIELGDSEPVPLRIKTRGNFRRARDNCQIPPLRLNFAAEQTSGTIFASQNKLKLVLPCRRGERYAELVELEALAYRIFAQLSSQAFRIRPLQITFIDSADGKQQQHPGFIIEDKKRLAERLAVEPVEVGPIDYAQLARSQAATLGLFQYLIGNTDWSMVTGPGGQCCHNVVLFQRGDRYLPIPYDFDFAGLVDAPYADPNEQLGIRSVRQRLYRGVCVRSRLAELRQQFAGQRDAIDALVENAALSKRKREVTRRWLDQFWQTLLDDRRAQRAFDHRCAK